MDGTLVDSEKLWDVALKELYNRRGRVLAPGSRDATVGGSADGVIRIVFDDLGLDPDPDHGPKSSTGCTTTSANCSRRGCRGVPAPELLDALLAADVPMALVAAPAVP